MYKFTITFSIFMVMLLFGCSDTHRFGYIIDKTKKQVIWRIWKPGSLTETQEKVLQGADVATFEILKFGPNHRFRRNSFGKDRNHVYWQGTIIQNADPQTFEEFYKGYYRYKDKNKIFVFNAMKGIIPLKDSDSKTFKVIDDTWACDFKQAYWNGINFVPHDIDSFEASDAKWGYWAKDKETCYWGYREVKKADRKTFTVSNDEHHSFARDSKNLFWQGWLVEGVDPDSFIIETSRLGNDGKFRYQFREDYNEHGKDVATYKMLVNKTSISVQK